jgi:hypothetical protein
MIFVTSEDEVLEESNKTEWFETLLDNILLGVNLLSDSDNLESDDEDSGEGSILKSSEVGLLGTSNAMDQDMDESSIPFDGVGTDEN